MIIFFPKDIAPLRVSADCHGTLTAVDQIGPYTPTNQICADINKTFEVEIKYELVVKNSPY
jgi:hypothetical protein